MVRRIVSVVFMVFSLMLSTSVFAELVTNQDYAVLKNPVTNDQQPKEKIHVVEFFSYGCPYCYQVEPEISVWLAQKPDNVVFTRIAIPRKGKWVEYARLFYALEMISAKEQERIMHLLYPAIHEQKVSFDSADALLDWVANHQVDRAVLETYYQSNEVTEKLAEAMELAKSYDLQYVPSIYVNGRYQLILDSSNQYVGTKDKLNELVKMASD